ncbi:MAG TPA: phage major capsid protein [Candidatus Solibacter sp.]|nr:phage major capsid protein [Candidatus Solibacter sp.]
MKVRLDSKSIEALAAKIAGKQNGPTVGEVIRAIAHKKYSSDGFSEGMALATRDLSSNAVPGSYLVPQEAYNQLIPALSRGGQLRRAGAIVVPMPLSQKMQIPVEGTISDDESQYLSDNDQLLSPITPDIQQRVLDLKHLVILFEMSANLARTSRPAFDLLSEQILARKIARAEDFSFFAGKANGPTSLLNIAGINITDQAGSTLAYSDILGLMETAGETEDEIENFVFFMSNLGLNKVRGLKDSSNRPILKAHLSEDGTTYSLLGHRIYLTPAIPNHVGSGSDCTYIAFLNPSNVMIGDAGLDVAVSTHWKFDSNIMAIRGTVHRDYVLAHPESACVLENVI